MGKEILLKDKGNPEYEIYFTKPKIKMYPPFRLCYDESEFIPPVSSRDTL
jgi:hypothetical protein